MTKPKLYFDGPQPDHPNAISAIRARKAELIRFRIQLEADLKAVTVDIDHLEAALRIFDPDDTPETRARYAALHRAARGQGRKFVLDRLREASGPLTIRDLADMWCEERGLSARPSTIAVMRRRMGSRLKKLHGEGLTQQVGLVDGLIGWRIA
jgi:hypothetical protein